jgi:tRNA-dihydrouridine synthase 3
MNAIVVAEPEQDEISATLLSSSSRKVEETIQKRIGSMPLGEADFSDVPLRFTEKKRLHWTGKTCELSPASSLTGRAY